MSNVIPKPKPTDFKPLGELTLGELLQDPRMKKNLQEAAPRHMSPDRLLRVIANAMRKTPRLTECSPLSLMGALITCATLGLEPNTPLGHAYLIPFDKRKKIGKHWTTVTEVNLILGYQGLIDLTRRTGSLVSLHADVVYEGDVFEFEYGSRMHLRHIPQGVREGRRAVYAYAHAKLEDGEAFEVLPYEEVLRIRDNTQAYQQAMRDKAEPENRGRWRETPWIKHEHEMAAKTMVRRLAKWLPKSVEYANALTIDSLGDKASINFEAIAKEPSLAGDPEAALQVEQGNDEVVDLRVAKQDKDPVAAERAKEPEPEPEAEVDEIEQKGSAPEEQVDAKTGEISDETTQTADRIVAELERLKTVIAIKQFWSMIEVDLAGLSKAERGRVNSARLAIEKKLRG
jgi:recombination protein RecT